MNILAVIKSEMELWAISDLYSLNCQIAAHKESYSLQYVKEISMSESNAEPAGKDLIFILFASLTIGLSHGSRSIVPLATYIH